MKFSIVIPIYNTESYLEESIESVLSQTYSNIEVILINDGSPRNAIEICETYAKRDKRIKFLSKENEGVSIARNLGIAHSTGDYVYCLDSDDTLEPQFIEKIYSVISEQDCNIVVCGAYFCNKMPEVIGALPTCAVVIKKDFLEKFPKIRFIEKMQPCEDGIFTHELLALTNKIAFCPNTKYFYRQNPNSSEYNITAKKILLDIPVWLKLLTDFYNEYDLWNSHKLHLLAFIENEPFGLRFCRMKLTIKQKIQLFNMIHNFIAEHQLYSKENLVYFNKKFCIFITSKNFITYKLIQFLELVKVFISHILNRFSVYKLGYESNCLNAGDKFNEDLMKKFLIKYKECNIKKSNLICCGSLLDNFIQNKTNKNYTCRSVSVAGCGFMHDITNKNFSLCSILKIKAIRGTKSFDKIKRQKNAVLNAPVLADPGLLASYIYPLKKEFIYDVGIIPHYVDKNSINLNNIKLQKCSYQIIDIQKSPEKVCNDICKCKCILSSSLHGLIFSDSFSVPNRQIILSNNKIGGGDYKFKDYYSSFNKTSPPPIDLINNQITDNDIYLLQKEKFIYEELIRLKQLQLIKIFNFLAGRK